MGRFHGILLASDFDNTLLYTEEALRSGGEIPAMSRRNVDAIQRWMAEGGLFAVATGRAMPAFRKYAFPAAEETRFELASLGNDAGICGAAKLVLG